jgi:large subunit ribosomal protein L21
VTIGEPYVAGAKVTAIITKQGRGKKIRVIKFKRKVRYARRAGHRQHYTMMKVTNIAG